MRVMEGVEISPERFVTMTHEELKSKAMKREDEVIRRENMRAAQMPKEEKAINPGFKCGKCGQRKVAYSQMQTRSADEPMTTFCECTNCGNVWKVGGCSFSFFSVSFSFFLVLGDERGVEIFVVQNVLTVFF